MASASIWASPPTHEPVRPARRGPQWRQGDRAWAATVRAQASIQRRSLAWPAPRPHDLKPSSNLGRS